MRLHRYDHLIHSLLCVRLGQELGASSDAAQAVASMVDFLIRALSIFAG